MRSIAPACSQPLAPQGVPLFSACCVLRAQASQRVRGCMRSRCARPAELAVRRARTRRPPGARSRGRARAGSRSTASTRTSPRWTRRWRTCLSTGATSHTRTASAPLAFCAGEAPIQAHCVSTRKARTESKMSVQSAATSQARMASAAFASPPLRLVALYGMSHNTLARACWPAWPCRQRTEGKGNPGCTLNDHRRPRCEAW